jgi:hypothetical protein
MSNNTESAPAWGQFMGLSWTILDDAKFLKSLEPFMNPNLEGHQHGYPIRNHRSCDNY